MKNFKYQAILMICLSLGGMTEMVSAASPSETSAVVKAVSQVKGDSLASIQKSVVAAKSLGWSSPTTESRVGLSGTWKFETSGGEAGSVTFKSSKITYSTGKSFGAFKDYSFLENGSVAGAPALVVLGRRSDGKWFLPFKKSGTLLLVNNANRRQWIALTK